jgi:hypothetical protein
MADNNYNPHLQGSDTLPSEYCDAPVANETAKDVQTAREAVRLHKEANALAEKGHNKKGAP